MGFDLIRLHVSKIGCSEFGFDCYLSPLVSSYFASFNALHNKLPFLFI
jgi:hypothetical protein